MPFTPSGMYWESRGTVEDPAIVLIEGRPQPRPATGRNVDYSCRNVEERKRGIPSGRAVASMLPQRSDDLIPPGGGFREQFRELRRAMHLPFAKREGHRNTSVCESVRVA